MKKTLYVVGIILVSCGVLFNSGCAKKSATASEAIQNSQSKTTVQEKVNYLMGQAETFYNSKEFQQAVQVAQYVLSNLDSNSSQAKDLIEKAKTQLQATAQKAVGDVTTKLFGK